MEIYLNKKKQPVGQLGDDHVYRSMRRGSKHILKMMDAWGIDFSIYEKILDKGCSEIRIYDSEDKKVYSINIDEFGEKGTMRDFDGKQIFLPRSYWKINQL